MRPFKSLAWGALSLAALAAGAGPAHAAWNNVFQVCCAHCGSQSTPVVAAYADPCCPQPCCPQPCPQTVCTTRYVQRCYYQPVTTYKTSCYYEPVTTYRTSYYYEPVTCYRYSCCYDPCTCSYQQVAQPVTSYRLRSRCCPVTSYLQRTCLTPVTTYQRCTYYEPVTTCCTTSTGGTTVTPPINGNGTTVPAPSAPAVPAPPASESTTTPPPASSETTTPPPGTELRDSYKPARSPALTPPGTMPRASDSAYRPPVTRPPVIRFDRIASRGEHNLQGRVVNASRAPRSGVRVLLVSVDAKTNQHTLSTDRDGVFQTNVAPGGWLVYTYDRAGKPVFSRRVEVPADRTTTMTVVQR